MILEIGTNDLCNISAEMVDSEIDDLVEGLFRFPQAESLFNQRS